MSVVPAVEVLALVAATVGRRGIHISLQVLGVVFVDQLFYVSQLVVQIVELLPRFHVHRIVLLCLVLRQDLLL